MKKLKKIISRKTIFLFLCLILQAELFAFDWPQEETFSDSFYSYFGQLRGGTISTSLIFRDSSDVKASEDAEILAILSEHTNDFGWFESTLGNTVILLHNDNISTVYANLDENSIPQILDEKDSVKKGEKIGTSANSGWQEGTSCLEFQVLDTKNHNAINPRILMPRIGKELPLFAKNVYLVDAKEKEFILGRDKIIHSGSYRIYCDRQEIAVPYKTTISINGVVYESLSYDTLSERNGKLCVQGNNFYQVMDLYPDNKRQFLGQINLTSGKHSLSATLFNILGTTQTSRFAVDVQ